MLVSDLQHYFKKTPTRVYSCEFREIYKNNFFTKHLWTTAFVNYMPILGLHPHRHTKCIRRRFNLEYTWCVYRDWTEFIAFTHFHNFRVIYTNAFSCMYNYNLYMLCMLYMLHVPYTYIKLYAIYCYFYGYQSGLQFKHLIWCWRIKVAEISTQRCS